MTHMALVFELLSQSTNFRFLTFINSVKSRMYSLSPLWIFECSLKYIFSHADKELTSLTSADGLMAECYLQR